MKKIVLMDDDDFYLDAMTLQLEVVGYQVYSARNGEEGWSLIQQHQPDLIITDVQMQRLNGFELCKRVKTSPQFCMTPVVMITGRSRDEDRFFNDYIEPDLYLTKPLTATELISAITGFFHCETSQ